MKFYEGQIDLQLQDGITVARMDGRAFHTFTKGLKRPYDYRLGYCMDQTCKQLTESTSAKFGYTQSDEITLIWEKPELFKGRYFKMVSSLAAEATLFFYRQIVQYLPDYAGKLPTFDARVFQVPNPEEAINVLRWRQEDATRNSVSMAAQSVASPKQLHGLNTEGKIALLRTKGIDWNDYPDQFKRGVFRKRGTVVRKFSASEIEKLPEKHAARANPDLTYSRTEYFTSYTLPFWD